jgi:hypothetical protein
VIGKWMTASSCLVAATIACAAASSAEPGVEVPFVGCPGDGQMGRQAPPTGGNTPRLASRELSARLAYYSDSFGSGVLAPRGWHCASLHGSNGGTLLVTPDSETARLFLNPLQETKAALGVQLRHRYGGTSGRFAVAEMIARHFPAYMDFARQVASEWEMDPLPAGPYPADEFRVVSPSEIEFTTPAGASGLGTERSRFGMGETPIHGIVILYPDEEMDLVQLTYRLPASDQDLAQPIIAEVRRSGREWVD